MDRNHAAQQLPRLLTARSPALACIVLAIELARTLDDLAAWWSAHKPALRALSASDLAEAVALKDARKAALAQPTDRPPDPGIPPPSVVLPPLRRIPGYDGRRLL